MQHISLDERANLKDQAEGHKNVVGTAGKVLADPMCGSGTFLIEAALMATHSAPGLYRRRWPFESWPDFDSAAWKRCVADAKGACRSWKGTLLGNDVHSGALSLAAKFVLCNFLIGVHDVAILTSVRCQVVQVLAAQWAFCNI